jgi:hypothetical protein
MGAIQVTTPVTKAVVDAAFAESNISDCAAADDAHVAPGLTPVNLPQAVLLGEEGVVLVGEVLLQSQQWATGLSIFQHGNSLVEETLRGVMYRRL